MTSCHAFTIKMSRNILYIGKASGRQSSLMYQDIPHFDQISFIGKFQDIPTYITKSWLYFGTDSYIC